MYDLITENTIDHSKVIVFDLETTGVDSKNDEILQVSLIDGNEKVLLNSYVKPYTKTEWKYAQQIHGISPKDVVHAPYLHELIPTMCNIFSSAQMLISYNGSFDMRFLSAAGIDLSDKKHFDVMRQFASAYCNGKAQKLVVCAQYFGYTFKAHDSLEDTLATLFCFKKLCC